MKSWLNHRWFWVFCWVWPGWLGAAVTVPAAAPPPTHQANGKWIADWLVLNRYLSSGEQERFLTELATNRNEPAAGPTAWRDATGQSVVWRRVAAPGNRFNVRATVGPDHSGKAAFLTCSLAADTAGEAEFQLNSALEVTLWLNGQELPRGLHLYSADPQGYGSESTRLFFGVLHAGTNQVLMRVAQLGLDRGFALRVLPPGRAVLTGRIFDAAGKALVRDVVVTAFQGRQALERIGIDESGFYHLSLLPEPGQPCDIAFTSGSQGGWWLVENLHPGDRLTRDVTLHPAVSLAGSLMMLDQNQSPHCEVTVEAVRDGKVVASVLSDEKGQYQFVNLKPGWYQVRCQTPNGYHYCLPTAGGTPPQDLLPGQEPAPILVAEGKPVRNLDAWFAAYKKGVWRHYDTLDGLPNNRVLAVAYVPGGGLWLQTIGGLGYYDGLRFSTVPGTESKPITALAAAPDGTVWFGTYQGLGRWAGGVLTYFTTTNGLPDNVITSLCVARSGEVWVGTGYGLSVYDGRRFRNYTVADGLVQNDITTLGQTPDGTVWVGTKSGLSRFDGRQFLSFTAADGLVGEEVTAVNCSSMEQVWVATMSGLSRWNGRGFTPLDISVGRLSRKIQAIYAAPDGRLWLGTGRGLSIFDGRQVINLHPGDGLRGENVMSIVATSEGFLWFATQSGLDRLDPQVANYSTKDGLADNRFFDLCAEPDALWLGMQWGGLGRFDGREFTTVLPGLYARKLHRTRDGVLWIGSNKGALRYEGTRLLPGGRLANHWVMAIASDSEGAMWFGDAWAGGGVVRATTNAQGKFTLKTFTREDGLAHNEVSSILCLTNGETWIGTAGGVSRFKGGQFQNFGLQDGLPSDGVPVLYQSKDGSIWLGTTKGVARYDGQRFSSLAATYGLPASRIGAIYQTRDGLMWFGTDGQGVCVFDGQAFAMLDTRDGLAGNSILAIAEDQAGNLWFGTAQDGLTCYRRKSAPPQVRLTQMRAGGQIQPFTEKPLRVRIGAPVTFSYEALDWLSPPEKRQYRISLRRAGGLTNGASTVLTIVTRKADFDWTPEATGDYALEIEAINLNLVYSQPVPLAFSVFRPWHESAVWRVPLGLSVAGLLCFGCWLAKSNWDQRRKVRRLKDQMLEQERATGAALARALAQRTEEWRQATAAALGASEEEARRIGRELHDTLCQDLIGVSRQAEAVALAGVEKDRVSGAMASRLQQLASLAAAAARQARELSHRLAISEPLEAPMAESLHDHVRQLERLYGFTCELSLGETLPAWTPEQGAHIIRIIREALVNAARHAHARRIWVDCLKEGQQTILSISSDGIAPQAAETWQARLGLRQMRMRANLLGATLTFRPGAQGAVVQLVLPDNLPP